MTRSVPSVLAGLIPALVLLSPSPVPAQDAGDGPPERGATRWPGFLGGRDANVSRAARLPLAWSDDSVAWRITTPGFGRSSPVIETGIRRRLEGLSYRMADQALLPDERLSEWVLLQAAP